MGEAPASIPEHVAIIMDGNGRWAKKRGLSRIEGHKEGAQSVRAVVRCCRDLGIKYLTLYAFSVENWIRPQTEIRGLMGLLMRFLKRDEHELHENHIRLRLIGRLSDLPDAVHKELSRVVEATKDYQKGQLILALSYGGRAEIVDATKRIAERVAAGELRVDQIDEKLMAEHFYAPDVPYPDLMVRTSGEMRLSNFLLWQLSYTELYVTDVLWPDFREADFKQAVEEFASRSRRFGDVS